MTAKNGKISKKAQGSGKLYNKWVNRNKKSSFEKVYGTDENESDEPEEIDDGDQHLAVYEPVEVAEIEPFEIARKNLANRTSYPISSNLDAWRDLRRYRYHMIKTDKQVNIWEMWPLYTNVDAACLVSYFFYLLFNLLF